MSIDLHTDTTISELQNYLANKHWLGADEQISSTEKPGEGNMNVVLRITTNQRSFIVKQAKDFVQKYPDIPAPIERIKVESDFYELTSNIEGLANYMPKLLGFDDENHVMVMQDLGVGSDYSDLYKKGVKLEEGVIKAATEYLSILHNQAFPAEIIDSFSDNMALRKLNHEHLFMYPMMVENGFDLNSVQDGLQELATEFKTDPVLVNKMNKLGEVYLSCGTALLHGDYYPGSWLNVRGEFKVIDPEFCFFGQPEYDLGVMIAHVRMAEATDKQIAEVWKNYREPTGFSKKLVHQFTGMELIRRLIGLAQLPLELDLSQKEVLLKEARGLLYP